MHDRAKRRKTGPKTPVTDWPALESRLAETLGTLEKDQYLVVSAKRGWA
jgi:hypothetical protein